MDPITKDAQFDENLVMQSMREEALLPDAIDPDWESREQFYARCGPTQLAKAAVFARQDAAIALMTAVRVRRDVEKVRGAMWIVIALLAYIAYRVS
jgi:hypothetical protein